VRFLIGQEHGEPIYRICEVYGALLYPDVIFWVSRSKGCLEDLSKEQVKPYKVNDKLVNQVFELKHGKSIRTFMMEKVSNAGFQQVCVVFRIGVT
jgi:RNA polymerase-associated protein RTF1